MNSIYHAYYFVSRCCGPSKPCMKSVQEILVLKGLAIQKRILLPKGFHPIVPRTERKDAWPSMKLTRGEVALHGAVVFARAAAAHSVGQARLA